MIPNPLEYHLGTFLRALTLEVTHALRRMVRTGLIAFFLVLVGGGIILTVLILGLGTTPLRPLAELSYTVLVVAALASGAAAASFQLSIAVLQGIERASKRVLEDIDHVEGRAVRSLLGITREASASSLMDGSAHQ